MFVSVLACSLLLALATADQLPPVPGADELGVGIDVITGDVKIQSLFKYSYSADKTWTNPFHRELVYSVPDQVEVVARTSSGSDASIYTTTTDYANKLSRGAGLEAGFGAAFSASAEVAHAKTFLASGNTALSVTEEVVKLNSLSLLPPALLQLSDALADAIAQHLPATYDEAKYATFVSYFGSHYVTSAEYGGKATMMSSVRTKYLGSNSALVANANARIKFQKLKGADLGASFSHSDTSEDYHNACQDSWVVSMTGGNAHLNISRWADWTDSVKLAPAQISYRLVSFDRIMPDEARAANFRTYLASYYAKHNKTETPRPLPPLQLERCQCSSFPFNGQPPSPDSLLVGLEETSGGHIGGTRQSCTPCYTLANKFGDAFADNAKPAHAGVRVAPAQGSLRRTDALFKRESARLAAMRRAAAQRKRQDAPMHNSTCGVLPCLPGVDSLGVGFDALYGELRDLRVVKFTYDHNKQWQNPFYPEMVYNYADQVNVGSSTSNNKYSATYNDTLQFANNLAQKAGLRAQIGAYGASADVSRSRTTLSGSQAVLNVLEQDITLYEASIAAFPSASASFEAMVAWLPKAYRPEMYEAFVAHFGTHFVSEATYGGTARQHSTIDQHFFTNKAGNAIAAGVNGAYADFKAGVRVNRTSSDDMKSFANNSISEIVLLGGNYERIEVSEWDKWQESTRLAPALVSMTLHPMSELISDTDKAKNLDMHIKNYIARGATAYKRVAVSRQYPKAGDIEKMDDGVGCDRARGASFIVDFAMNVPIVHSVLSPQECREVAWSKAPRGSTVQNNNLYRCNEYTTMSTECDQGGFMVTATYKSGLRGSWEPPITCASICWKQDE